MEIFQNKFDLNRHPSVRFKKKQKKKNFKIFFKKQKIKKKKKKIKDINEKSIPKSAQGQNTL